MKDRIIFSEILTYWLNKKRMSQADLAKALETSNSTVSQYKNGDRTPPFEKMEIFADIFGISLLEFIACKDYEKPELAHIKLVKAVPRAGSGGLETDNDTPALYSFHKSFIQRKGGTEESMRLFRVDGDSMEPTLFSGDIIMVNQAQSARHITTGNIYLLRLGVGDEAELMVKRLERRPGNVLLIRSDNDRYDDISVNLSEVDGEGEIAVLGRMVWSCREY